MKKFLFVCLVLYLGIAGKAQKVDSIFLNLYTDSLKKGQHNYINVDGKLSNGKWMPLSAKEIEFSCATAKFIGNELVIPDNFSDSTVSIKVVLKADPSIFIVRTIWIKQKPDPLLPSSREVMNRGRRS